MLQEKPITLKSNTGLGFSEADLDSLRTISHFIPNYRNSQPIFDYFLQNLQNTHIILAGNTPVGVFTLTKNKSSAEIYGGFRDNLHTFIVYPKLLKNTVFYSIADTVFFREDKQKMILKVYPDNLQARLFASSKGFNRLANRDKGRDVWVLTKKRYITRKLGLIEI